MQIQFGSNPSKIQAKHLNVYGQTAIKQIKNPLPYVAEPF
jgi:hypothetical protein